MGLERKQGWELRLERVLEDARHKRYVLGEHDCLRVAIGAVEALTLVDLWPKFSGLYSTPLGALKLIADWSRWDRFTGTAPLSKPEARALVERNGSLFSAVFSFIFGVDKVPATFARRGDICRYRDTTDHLGVCTGPAVAVLTERGLLFVDRRACPDCWMIG